MAPPKAQLRLNKELKRAVHSGDEYEDYLTLVQFLVKERSILALRLQRLESALAEFYTAGGKITEEDGTVNVTFGDLQYVIKFGPGGDVEHYSVRNPGGKGETEAAHKMFFCTYIRPYYESRVKVIDEQLADLDNDNTLRGICEIREAIRGDRWLTMSTVSGVDIQREEDIDPYGVFGREEDE